MASFTQKIVPRRIVELLRQGVTPEKLALSLALGVAIGVFPVLGTTTLLCALAAWFTAEFAGNSDRELFCVSRADCAAASVLSFG